MKTVPIPFWVLTRNQQTRIYGSAEIWPHAGRMRRDHAKRVVHGRLDHMRVLDGTIEIRERERLDGVSASNRFVEGDPVLPSSAIRERRLILVMARGAHLLVCREPAGLCLLHDGNRPASRVTDTRGICLLRTDVCRNRQHDPRQHRQRHQNLLHDPKFYH